MIFCMIDDDNNFGRASEYMNEVLDDLESRDDVVDEVCPRCGGSGWETVEEDGKRFAKPCRDCLKVGRDAYLIRSASIPEKYSHCTVESFELLKGSTGSYNMSLLKAKKKALEFVDLFPAVDKGLLFIGPCGVGKTHLAIGIIKELMNKGIACRFFDFRNLLRRIKKSYSSGGEETEFDITDPILEVDVLLLDEVGSIKTTDWALDMLTHIVIQRYNSNKTLIMTSNFLDEPREGEESLTERISYRLRSRFYEMCETVEMWGEDYRRRI